MEFQLVHGCQNFNDIILHSLNNGLIIEGGLKMQFIPHGFPAFHGIYGMDAHCMSSFFSNISVYAVTISL